MFSKFKELNKKTITNREVISNLVDAYLKLRNSGHKPISIKNPSPNIVTLEILDILIKLGFKLMGTVGTTNFLLKRNILIRKINKISEGSPHVVDLLKINKINLVINTTEGKTSTGDSYVMRRNTLLTNTPYYTTIKGANAAVNSIEVLKRSNLKVRSLQSIHKIVD